MHMCNRVKHTSFDSGNLLYAIGVLFFPGKAQ